MKLNKISILGLIFILLSGVIFTTDILNPIIRPITYLFLMGSSKGKDIMFFGLFGLFLISSQIIKKDINVTKYLKISIIIGCILLILGIFLEILFRMNMGIGLNTVFCSMTTQMSSTSILHTHLLKSILGEFLTNTMGSFIQSDINTGVGLYTYVPDVAKLIIILIPILFVMLILTNQKRPWPSTILLSFFSSCLIIGAIDGGLFGTPAIVGICGLYLIYRNGFYINYTIGLLSRDETLLSDNENIQPPYKRDSFNFKYFINRFLIYIVVLLIIILRFTIAFAGAESDYYTVDVVNPTDNIELNQFPIENITITNNTMTYIINSSYNEMDLINDLKVPLNNSCEYYTVSWNVYSYL